MLTKENITYASYYFICCLNCLCMFKNVRYEGLRKMKLTDFSPYTFFASSISISPHQKMVHYAEN